MSSPSLFYQLNITELHDESYSQLSLEVICLISLAHLPQATRLTLRLASHTGVATMQYEPMMSDRDKMIRDMPSQFLLHTIGSGTSHRHQTDAVAHTEHMRVHSESSLSPHHRLYHIGRLAPHPREPHQLLQGRGHLTSKVAH